MRAVGPNDILICLLPCFAGEWFFDQEKRILPLFGIKPRQLVVLCNTQDDTSRARKVGLRAEFVNHNCWLDENIFRPVDQSTKNLDAVLVSSPFPVKRAQLASQIVSLAVATHTPYPREVKEAVAPQEYFEELNNEEVAKLINRSRVGLCLSAAEGACYASSESLLCGVPVVSTPSKGGRDVWYTPHNHLLCEPTPDSVKVTVQELIRKEFEPDLIRAEHIKLATKFRERFVSLTAHLGADLGLDKDWDAIFRDGYVHKMVSFRPTADVIEELKS
jgi:hypothetical protein